MYTTDGAALPQAQGQLAREGIEVAEIDIRRDPPPRTT
jgi:hypothetical protein